MTEPTRRDFLRLTATATGVLALGFVAAPGRFGDARASEVVSFAVKWPPSAFVRIDEDETVTIVSNKSEMGQGIYTALAMLLAEELECDWQKVRVEPALTNDVYDSTLFPVQFTGGSLSIRTSYDQYRIIGAGARRMLIAAAAQRWGVAPTECTAQNGFVTGRSGQKLSYGQLTKAAAGLPVPTDVPLKAREDFKIVGKSQLRLDNKVKLDGSAQYAIDLRLPDMVTALVLHSPVYGGKPIRVAGDQARSSPGVKAVLTISTGVAVVADGFWHAKLARDLLSVDWDPGDNANLSTDEIVREFTQLALTPGDVAQTIGKPAQAMKLAALKITGDYVQPFLANAPMEPLCCVVHLKKDACEIWTGTQSQSIDRSMVIDMTGLKPEQVTLHTTFLGGGFGRRVVSVGSDWLREAVEIAMKGNIKVPLKLIWAREDDMTAYYYRPLWVDHVTVGLDRDGMPLSWMQTGVGQSIATGTQLEQYLVKNGIDSMSVEGATDLPYAIPNVQIDVHTPQRNYPVGWFRSVGHSHNAFVKETMIDEMAHAAGKDPVDYRRMLLTNAPRELAVLELAAAKAGWDRPMEQGFFRGVAVHSCFGSYVAQVVEISVTQNKTLKVERVVAAVDCGQVVNPDQVIAQVEGGIVFGLNSVIFNEVPIKQGKVTVNNFTGYKLMRMHQAPRIEVYRIDSDEAPGGAGEIAVPSVGPALANAIFAATGDRITELPVLKWG